ncbi:hypothetical protein L596_030665 [Steinernema carpocapsae]|uniref:FHA domain-containing protein n=1 Tax=Steinernema carpocapsae TaxID=34508 RepID=A0A4U5LQ11_STECR|nr:hypothetical protein L596_030665 [Steinernema carpocapsae]
MEDLMEVEQEPQTSSEGGFRVPTIKRPAPTKLAVPGDTPPPFLDYTPPDWALEPLPDVVYKLEVIKGGRIIEHIDLSKRKEKTFVLMGRCQLCDIRMDHPTMSRYHCVMQYGEMDPVSGKGWYVYDMGSTHGSRKNKKRLEPKTYERIYVGHVIEFGASTRLFTLQGPDDDLEPELSISVADLKKVVDRKAMQKKAFLDAKRELEREQKQDEKDKSKGQGDGISWGMMSEDAQLMAGIVNEQDDAHLMEDREQYYRNDPIKALEKFFEREGFDMEFNFTDAGVSSFNPKWKCSIQLPVDTAVGQSLSATSGACGSKKDAQTQCALEACRLLDTHGILRQSVSRNKTKQKQMKENDFYDSDEHILRQDWTDRGAATQAKEEDGGS